MPYDYAQVGQDLSQNLGQNLGYDPFAAHGGGGRRSAPAAPDSEAGQAIALKREQWDAFQKEMTQAQAEYEARLANIRPDIGETQEKLHDGILAPVLEKWASVPGFQRPTAEHYQEMKLKQEASDAAKMFEGQMRVSELIKGGMEPDKAILQNSQFFSPTAQAAALRRQPAPAQETFHNAYIPGLHGTYQQGSRGSLTRIADEVPGQSPTPKPPPAPKVNVEARQSRQREMAALLKANPWLLTGTPPSSWTGKGKAQYQKILDQYNELRGEGMNNAASGAGPSGKVRILGITQEGE